MKAGPAPESSNAQFAIQDALGALWLTALFILRMALNHYRVAKTQPQLHRLC